MCSVAPGTCTCFCTPSTLSCGLNRSCQQCVGQGRRMQQSDVEPFCYERASQTIRLMVPTQTTCITLVPKGRGENFGCFGGLGCGDPRRHGLFQIWSSWHTAGSFGLFQLSVECFKSRHCFKRQINMCWHLHLFHSPTGRNSWIQSLVKTMISKNCQVVVCLTNDLITKPCSWKTAFFEHCMITEVMACVCLASGDEVTAPLTAATTTRGRTTAEVSGSSPAWRRNVIPVVSANACN